MAAENNVLQDNNVEFELDNQYYEGNYKVTFRKTTMIQINI